MPADAAARPFPPRRGLVVLLLVAAPLALASVASWPAPAPVHAAQLATLDRCERIGDLEASVLAALDTRIAAFRERRATALERQAARWAEEDARREAALAAAKRRLADRVATLNPTTGAQREAVAAFRAAVEAALDERHATISAAIRAYRAGVVQALDEMLAETLGLFAGYRERVVAHIAHARAECASGVPPRTVLETLQANLAAARGDLEAALRALPSLQERLAPLGETLRSAITEAHAAFRAAVEAAAAELKTAFGSR